MGKPYRSRIDRANHHRLRMMIRDARRICKKAWDRYVRSDLPTMETWRDSYLKEVSRLYGLPVEFLNPVPRTPEEAADMEKFTRYSYSFLIPTREEPVS